MPEMYTCRRCGQKKPQENFKSYLNIHGNSTRSKTCTQCRAAKRGREPKPKPVAADSSSNTLPACEILNPRYWRFIRPTP